MSLGVKHIYSVTPDTSYIANFKIVKNLSDDWSPIGASPAVIAEMTLADPRQGPASVPPWVLLAGPAADADAAMAIASKPDIEVRRSQRRHRTVSAYREGGRIVVLIPDQFTRAEEREWVDKMLLRLAARDSRARRTDAELTVRAIRLANRYLADHPDTANPSSVRWVANQNGRWGSCTPADGTIRISDRIMDMPEWVIDYVIFHELVHLVIPSHDDDFWCLVSRYPKAERARGYLEGVAAVTGTSIDKD